MMRPHRASVTRREAIRGSLGALAATGLAPIQKPAASVSDKTLVAITLDLEMSRQYPTPDQMHWDYEKGNLDADTKAYAVEAARRVKRAGGVLHFFAVGRVLEQEDVDWLRDIHREGHPVGNHTYDHVNVKATMLEEIQFRFRRAPWLIEGKTPAEVISENIRMTSRALRQRVGIDAAGFRTPGGFHDGLRDRPDVQEMLLGLGFRWVSSLYPAHPSGTPEAGPSPADLEGIVRAQEKAQPFTYPSGLIEVPMSPVSDVSAMRSGRWKRDAFLEAVRRGIEWAIEHRATYDFLAHPSCLVVTDPDFRAIEMILDLVRRAGDRAAIVDLGTIATRARR
jgi:peptidoglycan/xylan/chitin deacetylase (PgdA/CDA1 family)